jgi:hypothetical protein
MLSQHQHAQILKLVITFCIFSGVILVPRIIAYVKTLKAAKSKKEVNRIVKTIKSEVKNKKK